MVLGAHLAPHRIYCVCQLLPAFFAGPLLTATLFEVGVVALLVEPADLPLLRPGGNNAMAAFAGVFVPDGDLFFATADTAGDSDGVFFFEDGHVREEGRLVCSAIAGVVVPGVVLAGTVVAGIVMAGGCWATLEGSFVTRPCTPTTSLSLVSN